MANLIIKPTSGGSLILQDEGGTAAHTIDASGNHTLSGSTNNIGTVTSGSISNAVMPAGSMVNFGYKQDSTRRTLTRGFEVTFGDLTMSYNKLHASSLLVVSACIPGHDDQDGHCQTGFKYGSTATHWSGAYTYDGGNYMKHVQIHGVLAGHTTTGAQTLKCVYGGKSGSTLAPMVIMNPDANDSGSEFTGVTISTMTVWEVLV